MSKELPLFKKMLKNAERKAYGERDGTPIEKGFIVTEDKLIASIDKLEERMQYYSAYPDMFMEEVMTPADSNFKFLFTQRIFLRAMMRFRAVHITAARGFSKTFTSVIALMLKCIMQPGSKIALSAPTKSQAAEIGGQKIKEILMRFPLLSNELIGTTFGKDYATATFRNGSRLEITAALESTRGRRYSALMVDELRDQDGDMVNSVLLPTLVIARRTKKGNLNPYERHHGQIFTTSASSKSSYNYEKLLELFQMGIIRPNDAITFGIDYRVPVIEGLMTNENISNMKLDPTFKEADFAREFLSIYTSDNEDSWFNFTQMTKHRKIVNAEWSGKTIKGLDQFYLLSVDVGRLSDQTVVTVFKVNATTGKFKASIVNIYVLGRTAQTKPFSIQARDIKAIAKAFNPREIVMDINGLGIGLADEMIKAQWGPNGEYYEPYAFNNSDDYKKIQPKDAPMILYGIKANGPLNSQMFGNCYSRIGSGVVDFLIKEQDARGRLLATKQGQQMSTEQKVRRLMPYEMTAKLFEEMGNLRLKRTGAGLDIVLEQINTRFPKDKFSSLIMGLWRIKELEDEATKKRRKNVGGRKLTFFTGGK